MKQACFELKEQSLKHMDAKFFFKEVKSSPITNRNLLQGLHLLTARF